ncbi:hypothetical protein R6Q57_011898 [Mikania cordata]
MSWWDEDVLFGQYSDVSRVAETYQEETGVQSSEAINRPVLPDLNEEVAGQTSYWQFDLNQEPCFDEDVNRECYAGEQSHPPLVAVKEEEPEEEPDVIHQNMDWNTNETSCQVPQPAMFSKPPPPPELTFNQLNPDLSYMSSSDEMEGLHDNIDDMDELIHHPWLQLPQGTIARNRRDRLLRKEMGQQKAIDYDLLAELGQLERMTTIIGEDTPWSRLFEMTFAPQYRLITVEFLSTFVFTPRAADQAQPNQQQPEVSFRLCGDAYTMSLAEFGHALGLYTQEELQMPIYTSAIHTADDAVVSAWWPRIGDEPFVRAARVTRIRDPLIR